MGYIYLFFMLFQKKVTTFGHWEISKIHSVRYVKCFSIIMQQIPNAGLSRENLDFLNGFQW